MSNAGRIVVKKRIAKIEKGESFNCDSITKKLLLDKNGKVVERKKKGRLYSLGGNDPPRKNHRGRLDRLKTVGTFDLGTEMCVLSQVARNLNEQIISGELKQEETFNKRLSSSPAVSGIIQGSSGLSTPSSGVRRDISRSTGNFSNKFNSNLNIKLDQIKSVSVPAVKTQNSAEEYNNCSNCNLVVSKNCSGNPSSPLHSPGVCCGAGGGTCSGGKQRYSDSSNRKTRSLSTGSYLVREHDRKSPILTRKSDNSILLEKTRLSSENDSNKIAEDFRSFEETNKDEEDEFVIKNTFAGGPDVASTSRQSSRKPQLRKSKRIVRSDSEFLVETAAGESRTNEIILYANTDIQIHTEPLDDDHFRLSSVESSGQSRIDSSDMDELDRRTTTDESSRNLSTDELDTVFSDSTDLEQLEKDYREHLRSNLQREYKSDGDTLDEIGRKRTEFGKWKNQSFDNDIDMFPEKGVGDPKPHKGEIPSISSSNDRNDSIVSPREVLSNVSSPKDSDNSYSIQTSGTNSSQQKSRPSELDVIVPTTRKGNLKDSKQPSSEGSLSSLFEKRFGKFKKMNKLLKSKRFSSSLLYEKKKSQITRTEEVMKLPNNMVIDPRYSRSSPAKSNISDSKSSIYSSKGSLYSTKGPTAAKGKGFSFLSRKSSIFSNSSHSNTDLNADGAKSNEISKSSTEINKIKTSPFRFSCKRKENKNKSTACLNLETSAKCHSPLSEEFYNKTGSVRLSAMELFEKFCSEDFGGLYKHENMMHFSKTDDEESGSPMQGSRQEYLKRMSTRGLGAIRKYQGPRNVRLLKQKSEPKFMLRGNDLNTDKPSNDVGAMYYHQEEDEEYYNEREAGYAGEYDDEDNYEGEDEDIDEEDEDQDEDVCDECREEYEDGLDQQYFSSENQTTILEMVHCDRQTIHDDHGIREINSAELNSHDVAISTDSEVDEIFLMPNHRRTSIHYDRPPLIRVAGIDRSLNNLNECSSTKDIREIAKYDSDEILTVYRICSKDDILSNFRMSDNNLRYDNISSHNLQEKEFTKSTPSFMQFEENLESAVNNYIKNAPSMDEQPPLDPNFTKTDCISVDRTDSSEPLSHSSGTFQSGSTLTEYGFDTVRNVNLDSCSTSKLSLSIKSEVFEEFTLTPDELTSTKPIRSCDLEDFTLTPEGSVSDENVEANREITEDGDRGATINPEDYRDNKSDDLHNVIKMVDNFIANERSERNQLSAKLLQKQSNFFNFEQTLGVSNDSAGDSEESRMLESQYTIVDLDEESLTEEQTRSAFTTKITKEFDLLFYRAEENSKIDDEDSSSCAAAGVAPTLTVNENRLPTRYSMQKLEPIEMNDLQETNETAKMVINKSDVDTRHLDDDEDDMPSPKCENLCARLTTNRSQSLGNLNKKTRCFPL